MDQLKRKRKTPSSSSAKIEASISETKPLLLELQDQAATLFMERGYEATTTRQLAAHLKMQKASLYYHIATKEELLFAICKSAHEEVQRAAESAVASSVAGVDRIQTLIRAHITATLTKQNKHAVMLIDQRSLSAEHREELRRMRASYARSIRGILREAQKIGAIRTDIEPKYLSLALSNLLNWTILWFDPSGPLSVKDFADLYCRLYLDGVVSRKPDKR
jgi:TetR/AcrR family transcriptional regulator, cholesterol catabolism regulator